MNEWILLIYPIVLFACLMVAARLQPKSPATTRDERKPEGKKVRRPR